MEKMSAMVFYYHICKEKISFIFEKCTPAESNENNK